MTSQTDMPGQIPIRLNVLGSGQFFGWSSLFPPERKMFSTRAVKSTRAIAPMKPASFDTLRTQDAGFITAHVAVDASRLRAVWQTDHELEYALIRRAGRDLADRIRSTRQELANMLSSIRAG